MSPYLLFLDGVLFHDRLAPCLAASWRTRSFEPCQRLCADLLPAARDFAQRYHTGFDESLLHPVIAGMSFDRTIWRSLAGEVLLYAAADVPELPAIFEPLDLLLAAEKVESGPRDSLPPIRQVRLGSRDLVFGGAVYRPDQAGFNDRDDVRRLASYLRGIDDATWAPVDLADLPDLDEEERDAELDFAREGLALLRGLYHRAEESGQVVVCELL